MPKVTSPDTTPRRARLRGFIAGTFASAAALSTKRADAAGGTDAELIALCAPAE